MSVDSDLEPTHCKRGHPLAGDNLRIVNGRRRCAACHALQARIAYRAERGLPGEGHPRERGDGRIDLVCPVCGRAFWRYRSQARWRGARYCSRQCQAAGVTKASTITCRQCGRQVLKPPNLLADAGRGKFCDRRCYISWHREHASYLVNFLCDHCGVAFATPAAWAKRNGRHFCSRRCASAARRRGPRLPRRGAAWKELAEVVRERDGRTCVRCGSPEADQRHGRLQVDHIIPARLLADRPDVADDERNLAALCAACHCLKTHRYEPRIHRGDFLAIEEFYGHERRLIVTALVGA